MLLFFERSKPLTHKIDNILISEIKKIMPFKYYSFQLANFVSGVLFLCFLCSFVSYFVFSIFLQNSGIEIDQSVTIIFAKVIVGFCLSGFACWFLRTYLYTELERQIMKIWYRQGSKNGA
ncbi:hypothetical protein GQB61_004302 [Salmonella enterica]|nr:hypothetical protein [Salmonella enterica]